MSTKFRFYYNVIICSYKSILFSKAVFGRIFVCLLFFVWRVCQFVLYMVWLCLCLSAIICLKTCLANIWFDCVTSRPVRSRSRKSVEIRWQETDPPLLPLLLLLLLHLLHLLHLLLLLYLLVRLLPHLSLMFSPNFNKKKFSPAVLHFHFFTPNQILISW